MLGYLVNRLLFTVFVALSISFFAFVLLHFIPGDPAQLLADQWATKEHIEALRKQWGLDKPLFTQFAIFMMNLCRGNLGTSIASGRPVAQEIAARLPNTMILALAGTLIGVVSGLGAGILSGCRPYSLQDELAMFLALFGVSLPPFWFGLMLMWLFAVKWRMLPSSGAGTLAHLVLPAFTLGIGIAAVIARQTRASMLDVLRQPYILTAYAKGLKESVVVCQHALRNALIPIITVTGLIFGRLLGGSVVVETVFGWPGLGRFLVEAIFTRDYPVIRGALLIFGLTFAFINLIVDLTYGVIDPRIKYA
ncbi:MAG: ABC transporter permease [Thermofilaceae archaeon]